MIQVDLPAELEAALRKALGRDLALTARDALLVEAYRRGAVSAGQIATALGTSINGAYAFLVEHGQHVNYDVESLHEDAATMRALRRKRA